MISVIQTRQQKKDAATQRRLTNLRNFKPAHAHEQHEPQQSHAVAKKKKRRRSSTDDDTEWSQVPTIRRRRQQVPLTTTTADAASQTRKQQPAPVVMSHRAVLNMHRDASLTGRQTLTVMKHVRSGVQCRGLFQPHFKEVSETLNHLLDDYFKCVAIDVDGFSRGKVWSCFATDLTALFRRLEELHDKKIKLVHLGADNGKASMKVHFSLEFMPDEAKSSDAEPSDAVPAHGRRRIILIAVIPIMKEQYNALYDVFQRLCYPAAFPFVFIGDLKMMNILFGLSTNAATFPCPLCEQRITSHSSSSKSLQLSAGRMRTYSNIVEHFKALTADGRHHKYHASVIHKPLPIFADRPDVEMMSQCGMPGLHLLLGANWCFSRLHTLWSDVSSWWESYSLVRSDYHGGDFEGTACRFLLRPEPLAELRKMLEQHAVANENSRRARSGRSPRVNVPRHEILLLYDVLSAFGDVATGCFSKILRAGWQEAIAKLRVALIALPGSRVTVKFHVVTAHVERWCLKHGVGLGAVSEQSFESLHQDYYRLWTTSYPVNDVTSNAFRKNIKACTVALNSRHVPLPLPAFFESYGRSAQIISTGAANVWQGPVRASMLFL